MPSGLLPAVVFKTIAAGWVEQSRSSWRPGFQLQASKSRSPFLELFQFPGEFFPRETTVLSPWQLHMSRPSHLHDEKYSLQTCWAVSPEVRAPRVTALQFVGFRRPRPLAAFDMFLHGTFGTGDTLVTRPT